MDGISSTNIKRSMIWTTPVSIAVSNAIVNQHKTSASGARDASRSETRSQHRKTSAGQKLSAMKADG